MDISNQINITGVTRLDCYPPHIEERYCKQNLENDIVCIPSQKPDIESINEVKVGLCIDHYEVIDTCLGPKLILKGTKSIKVLYTADNHQQSCHSAHWEHSFCDFVLLKGLNYDQCCNSVKGVFVGLESVIVKDFDCRHVDLSIIYIICPIIEQKKKMCVESPDVIDDKCKHLYNGKKVKLLRNQHNSY